MSRYLILLFGALMCSIQFTFTKRYQKAAGDSLRSLMFFSLTASAVSAVYTLILSGFHIEATPFSLLFALLLSVFTMLTSFLCIKAARLGKLSVYTLFMMLGGMLLPFVMGLAFLSEKLTIFRAAAFLMITAALVLPVFDGKGAQKQKSPRLFYIFCILLFIFNGLYSCTGKLHQIGSRAVPTFSFLFFSFVFQVVIASAVLLFTRSSDSAPLVINKNSVLSCVGFALFSSTGAVANVSSAAYVDAAVLYPIVTGGSIIFSAVCGLVFFGEKLTKYTVAGIVISVAATVLFMF